MPTCLGALCRALARPTRSTKQHAAKKLTLDSLLASTPDLRQLAASGNACSCSCTIWFRWRAPARVLEAKLASRSVAVAGSGVATLHAFSTRTRDRLASHAMVASQLVLAILFLTERQVLDGPPCANGERVLRDASQRLAEVRFKVHLLGIEVYRYVEDPRGIFKE